jgi:hypothetical protein
MPVPPAEVFGLSLWRPQRLADAKHAALVAACLQQRRELLGKRRIETDALRTKPDEVDADTVTGFDMMPLPTRLARRCELPRMFPLTAI